MSEIRSLRRHLIAVLVFALGGMTLSAMGYEGPAYCCAVILAFVNLRMLVVFL